MDPIISKQRIASLILKENTVGLNEAEQEELNLWRQTDPRNERTYTRLHEKMIIKKTYQDTDKLMSNMV